MTTPPEIAPAIPTLTSLPVGFSASGVAANIKKNGKPDVAMILSDLPCSGAAVFTTNRAKAAPVLRGMAQMVADPGAFRAIVINAGCANACTGVEGEVNARIAAEAVAQHLGAHDNAVFVMSTGAAGKRLRVKTPAARQGVMLATSARSGAPFFLIPAAAPPASKPVTM